MPEIWKPVVGYEGRYEVSNLGRIRSLDRYCLGKDGREELHKGKILRPWVSLRGQYLYVTLSCKKKKTVHSVVAEAFLGRRPDGYDILHLDGNRQNNSINNLRYGTRKENLNQTYEYGGRQAAGKLTKQDAIAILRRLAAGEKPTCLANEYRVNRAAIYHIKNRTTFKWLSDEEVFGCAKS